MASETTVPALIPEPELAPPRRFRTLRDLLRKKIALLAIAYLAIFYACGLLAPFIAPYGLNDQQLTVETRLQPPSADHLLGTDRLGRDMLTRVLYSARTTVVFTIVIVISGGLFLGLGLGLLAGYRGGWVDTAIMRTGEVLSGMPTLILMLAITASFRGRINSWSFWLEDHTFLGDDSKTLVKFTIISLATVPFAWLGSSRIVRSQVLAIREQAYVTAAESLGATTPRILIRHVLPGVMPLFLVGLSSGMAGIAGAEVALSYLGLGIDEPAASFGNLIGDVNGTRFFEQYPYLLVAGAGPVILFLFSWNLLGDALVDVFDRRQNSHH
ncbi:ABC transporter permease [Candidatus Amarobacter glycogenicus]|uniref:ABC transporter permease n=1 Tax=Candidatus Amarobacter glycogenicus TaxID=3140699 RepID=UPI002A178144|nr:ABC transporter permease [Dehalococcoidia bacterium]